MQVPRQRARTARPRSPRSRASLKALAKELDVPVVALSQLNRSVEQRTRQAAGDVGPARVGRDRAGRGRDRVHLPRRGLQPGHAATRASADIIIGKQRNGPSGSSGSRSSASSRSSRTSWTKRTAKACFNADLGSRRRARSGNQFGRARASRAQVTKNPIFTPASWITSLSCSLRACGPIAMPFTSGNPSDLPLSTCTM